MNSLLAAQYNTSRVLRLLWLKPGISRAEIADGLGLNRSTITHIVKELTEQGVVEEVPGGSSGPTGGRKNVRLVINRRFGCVAGFDVHPNHVRITGVDLMGEIVFEKQRWLKLTGKRLYDNLRRSYEWTQKKSQECGLPLLGVGCGVSGIVRPEEGTIQQSIPLEIEEAEPFVENLRSFISEPVFVENDANCCCWGELVGNRSGEKINFMFVNGGWRSAEGNDHVTAIGMGIVIDNMVYHGKDFSAGEFRSVEWKAGNKSQFSMSDREIATTKENRAAFLQMTRELARNTALIVNVLDLERLYLGGFFEDQDREAQEIFRKEILRNWSYPNQAACDVRFSTYGENAVAYGAAGLLLGRFFQHGAQMVLAGRKAGLHLLTG